MSQNAKTLEVMQHVVEHIAQHGKGILAADESNPTIQKRFDKIQLDSTEANRRAYRELIITTPNLGHYVSGIILFEETLGQADKSGKSFVDILKSQSIIPGIKVDKGLVPFLHTETEKMTQGLDQLGDRLEAYKKQGAQFAKWRAVFNVPPQTSTRLLIKTNANHLAIYAAMCQKLGVVPIVEPEILMDGTHTIEQCAEISERVFHSVFHSLYKYKVSLEHMILKPSMVIAGKESTQKSTPNDVATHTLRIFERTIPAAVKSINFLSGGQSPEQATQNLNAINQAKRVPWHISFSYGRALLDPCLTAWSGKDENRMKAQAALLDRAKANSAACMGEYRG